MVRHDAAHGLDVAHRPVAGRVVPLDGQHHHPVSGEHHPGALGLEGGVVAQVERSAGRRGAERKKRREKKTPPAVKTKPRVVGKIGT